MSFKKLGNTSGSRDVGLDGLRTIGLLAIILAHVSPPSLLFQIRNFDVPLMILVSGAVFSLSSGATKSYTSYFLSRVGRLIIPTWIFLTIFFVLVFLIARLTGQSFPFSPEIILSSFGLTSGTGYVWIIRVFILVAISLPFIVKLHNKLGDKKKYLFLLFIAYVFYEAAFLLYSITHIIQGLPIINFMFQNVIFYILPYGIIAGLGFYLTKVNKKTVASLAIFFLLLFLGLALSYSSLHFVPTQNFKYPPRIYYISYALTVSLILYLLSKTQNFKKMFENKLLIFISSSSLWIFLWQILFLYIWSTFRSHINASLQNYIVEYVFVLLSSITLTFLQKLIIGRFVNKIKNYEDLSKFLTIAFLR